MVQIAVHDALNSPSTRATRPTTSFRRPGGCQPGCGRRRREPSRPARPDRSEAGQRRETAPSRPSTAPMPRPSPRSGRRRRKTMASPLGTAAADAILQRAPTTVRTRQNPAVRGGPLPGVYQPTLIMNTTPQQYIVPANARLGTDAAVRAAEPVAVPRRSRPVVRPAGRGLHRNTTR